MASGTKSDLMSASPDGHGYFNPQRGAHAALSLERSRSFREGGDRYTMFPTSSSSRSAAVDPATLLQSLAVDLRPATVDHKTSRFDVKKSISSILGTSPEVSTSTPSIGRNISSAVEEIRHVKSNLNDISNKARERARAFGGAVMKIDRLCPNNVRKRSRGDGSSNERSSALLSGGAIPNNVPQSHLNDDMELGPQRIEERTKNAGQNRRIRTSVVEMDARTTGPSRGPGLIDRNSDPGKATNGGSAVSEEKIRGLATSIDGWEKPKMKKKRSTIKADMSSTGVSRTAHTDRELKQGQHKFNNDGRARMASSPSFRSGTIRNASGTTKAELLSGQNSLVGRPLNRSDQDNGFHPSNKRDHQVILDKELPSPRLVNKTNDHDSGANISSLPKANGSVRGPRSNSGLLLKPSPNIHRLQATSDDWENPPTTNKLISASGSGNAKRTKSTQSLSPPTQWGGQRPQKISRSARKSNLVPIITTPDGASVPGSLDSPVNEDPAPAGLSRHTSVNGLQQTKRDHGLSTGSEGDEPGIAEKKLRDKSKRACELDDGNGSGFQKIAMLGHPSKRNKLSATQDIGDAAWRQGRVGRGFIPTRPGTSVSIDKTENAPTTKQRSVRMVSERNDSKSGRPMMKKISERKGNTRPRHISSSILSDSPVQLEDDHEELLAAANASLRSCANPFWRQVEPFFGFLTAEDISYLCQQIHSLDCSTSCRLAEGDESQKYKGSLEYISQPSTPAASNKDDHTALPNGYGLNQLENRIGVAWETSCIEPILDQLVQGIGVRGGASVGQRLIQALIDEDKIESIANNTYRNERYPFDTHEIHFDEGGWKTNSRGYGLEPLMNFEESVRGPNGLVLDSDWKNNDDLSHRSGDSMRKAKVWPELQYSEMCFSDRIIIELSEVGVSVEPVPDLVQSEDEDINAEICKLEGQLRKEVVDKKNLLLKLDGIVRTAKETQQREFSRRSMDRLLLIAYEKYMAFYGPNSKNINRAGRHGALSFVKRTLARYRNYEEVGVSCFDEPTFKDMFVSATSHRSGPDFASQDNNTVVSVHKATVSNALRASSHLTDLSFAKEDPWTNNVKQRELLLDEVVGSITGGTLKTSGLGTSLVMNTKGKRSERDREGKGHSRDGGRTDRPSSSNAKGERKNKTKPKQKTANISAPTSSSRDPQLPTKIMPSSNGKNTTAAAARRDDPANASNDAKMPDLSNLELSNLELPAMDGDFSGWLNIDDDDGLQDLDLMGLEIPMDDINEINLMI